jgi:hypothetical protein
MEVLADIHQIQSGGTFLNIHKDIEFMGVGVWGCAYHHPTVVLAQDLGVNVSFIQFENEEFLAQYLEAHPEYHIVVRLDK